MGDSVDGLRLLDRARRCLGVGPDSSRPATSVQRGGVVIIEVDPSSPVPPYEQLRSQIATMIESGVLPGRHRLPSVRQLAGDLGLANGTVARAYRELEGTGLVTTAGRHGTVVAADATVATAARTSRLRDAADAFVRLAQQLGAADQETYAALVSAGLQPTNRIEPARASE